MSPVSFVRSLNHRALVGLAAQRPILWGIFDSMSYLLRAKLPNLGGRHRFCRSGLYDDPRVPAEGNSRSGSRPPTMEGGFARAGRSRMRRLLRWRTLLSVFALVLSA